MQPDRAHHDAHPNGPDQGSKRVTANNGNDLAHQVAVLASRTAIAFALIAAPAVAQGIRDNTDLPRQIPVESQTQDTTDVPIGAPYRTGQDFYNDRNSGNLNLTQAQVPLRDYLSSRIDSLRSEMLDKLESLERQQTKTQDERDRQYSQRFAAQQDAVEAALASAKEAVTKAEDASNKRFDSVNEFRQTLDDQAKDFVTKDIFTTAVKAIENQIETMNEKTTANTVRLNSISDSAEGAANLWGYMMGAFGLVMAIAAFAFNISRRQPLK